MPNPIYSNVCRLTEECALKDGHAGACDPLTGGMADPTRPGCPCQQHTNPGWKCTCDCGHDPLLPEDTSALTVPQRLVTIDLDDEETLEQIAYAYRKYEGGRDAYVVELALMDVFRPPTPMPEGMFAVVRDAEGREYCQVGPDQWLSLNDPDGRGYFQNLTQPVEVLFPGVDTGPDLPVVDCPACHPTAVGEAPLVHGEHDWSFPGGANTHCPGRVRG